MPLWKLLLWINYCINSYKCKAFWQEMYAVSYFQHTGPKYETVIVVITFKHRHGTDTVAEFHLSKCPIHRINVQNKLFSWTNYIDVYIWMESHITTDYFHQDIICKWNNSWFRWLCPFLSICLRYDVGLTNTALLQ